MMEPEDKSCSPAASANEKEEETVLGDDTAAAVADDDDDASSGSSVGSKGRRSITKNKTKTNTHMAVAHQDEDGTKLIDEDDDSSTIFIEGGSSPYEDDENSAEVGEPLFEELQALLTPNELASSSTSMSRRRNGTEKPTQQAIDKLGSETAHAMVTAKVQIAQSGIVYSPEWRDSKHIRGGVPIPALNASMILLCLRDDRLCRADAVVLTRLSKELGVTGIVHEAIDFWNLNKQFCKLSSRHETTYSFDRSHLLACLKCAIFVARTFEAMTLLEIRDDEVIRPKVLACLRTMEENLIVTKGCSRSRNLKRTSTKQQQAEESLVDDSTSGTVSSDEDGTNESSVSSDEEPANFSHNDDDDDDVDSDEYEQNFDSDDDDDDDDSLSDESPSRNKRKRKRSTGKGYRPGKTAVEQLDAKTGELLGRFASQAAASEALGKNRGHGGISGVIRGEHLTAMGYFWRPVGSDVLPHLLRPDYKKNLGRCQGVEQLDLKTGEVLATFHSITAAGKAVGVAHQNIQQVICGSQNVAAGYFWRRVGSDEKPRKRKLSANAVAVEQVCMKTGKGLRTFPSLVVAGAIVGIDDDLEQGNGRGICEVLAGRAQSACGYFWRKPGSNALPHCLRPGYKPPKCANIPVEQLDIDTGEVLATYPNLRAAGDAVGLTASIVRPALVGNRRSAGGYFWRRVGSSRLPDKNRIRRTEKKSEKEIKERLLQYQHVSCKIHHLRTKVEQVDPETGEVLASFPTMKAAGDHFGISQQSIQGVIYGKNRLAAGFFWRRAGSDAQVREKDASRSVAVEQVCVRTGKLLATHPSQMAAAKTLSKKFKTGAIGIHEVIYGRTETALGFYWRKVGCKSLPHNLRPGSSGAVRMLLPVEKLDFTTGEVLEEFPTLAEAAAKSSLHRNRIRDVLTGNKESAGGYFWRLIGSKTLPPGLGRSSTSDSMEESEDVPAAYQLTLPPIPRLQPWKRTIQVEQLDLATGEVLAEFRSLSHAMDETGVSRSHLKSVLEGTKHSAGGFFWREKQKPEGEPRKKVSRRRKSSEDEEEEEDDDDPEEEEEESLDDYPSDSANTSSAVPIKARQQPSRASRRKSSKRPVNYFPSDNESDYEREEEEEEEEEGEEDHHSPAEDDDHHPLVNNSENEDDVVQHQVSCSRRKKSSKIAVVCSRRRPSPPKKRPRVVNKDNAEVLAMLVEEQCRKTLRTFKELRRAYRKESSSMRRRRRTTSSNSRMLS